ncbi:MAG TPA: Ku protein [Kineosporiaceae bacterium]|nr:Ku protein [Kineosporiaceae bacterium]
MRAIWKGAVSFGLVNVPVRLFAATQEHDIRFHQVHREDGGRIRMKRICSIDGEEVPYDQLAKGYESADGRLVILTDEDFASLPLAAGREIEVVEFVPVEQVDPILYGRSYYLEPETRAAKPYVLLREALEATQRLAVVKVAMRQRESLAVLRVRDKVIVLQTLLWPDEVRAPAFDVLDTDVELRPQELTMAQSLVESLAADFEPEEFEDEYATALAELVDAKLEGAPPAPAARVEAGAGTEVVDLLTALQRSVERARASRGEDAGDAGMPTAPAAKPAAATTAASPRAATTAAKTGTAKTATAKTGTAKTAAAKTATAKTGTAKTAAAKTAAAKKTPEKAASKRAGSRKTA